MPGLETIFPTGMSQYITGGICIGLGVSLLFIITGLVGGMSSVFSTSFTWLSRAPFFQDENLLRERQWRLVYAVGLVIGAAVWAALPQTVAVTTELPIWQLAIGGFLGGFGARYGNGCTSGHGICGIASFSLTSLLAVLVFMATAIITAHTIAYLQVP